MIGFYNIFLKKTDFLIASIKVVLMLCFVVAGFFFNPLFAVACVLGCVFIICENNINSFYIVLFFFSFFEVFTFKNNFGLSYWVILMIVFIIVMVIKTLKAFIKKEKIYDYKVLIPFMLLAIYFSVLVFLGGSLIYLFKSILWLTLFYLFIVNRKEFNLKASVLFFVFGIIIASFIGIFTKNIPYLAEKINIIYAYDLPRFSGLFVNPNILYVNCIFGICFIYLLAYYGKISKWWIALIFPLTFIGIHSLSKTFLICFVIFVLFALISILIHFSKRKTMTLIILSASLILAILFAFPYFSTMIARIMPRKNVEQASASYVTLVANELENQESIDTLTTGRYAIWGKYLKDFKSSTTTMLFGRGGGSADKLDVRGIHNGYLQILYEYGIVGTILIIGVIIYLAIHLKFFKKKWLNYGYLTVLIMALIFMSEAMFLSQNWACLVILSIYFLSIREIDQNAKL